MAEFKIALYGQIDNDTKFGFTYPDDFNPINVTPRDEWLRSISEPRDARVFKTEAPVYATWKNDHGNYFASIFPNRQDSRNGYLILTLFVGPMIPRTGKTVVDILSKLEDLIVNQNVREKARIGEYLSTMVNQFEADRVPASTAQKDLKKAFRAYSDDTELYDLLQHVNQDAYVPYRRVLFVPRTSVPTMLTPDYVELKNVIARTFNVMVPADGTQVSKRLIKDGEELVITYSRTGFETEERKVKVSRTPNELYTIEGTTLTVRSAKDVGISFLRGFILDVCSTSGTRIDSFQINGQQHHNGDKVKVAEAREYQFKFKAAGYEDYTEVKQAGQLTSTLRIRMQPKDMGMPVTMRHHGRDIHGHITVKADDPLYPFLKSSEYRFEIKGGGSPKGGGNSNRSRSRNAFLWVFIALCIALATFLFLKMCDDTPEESVSSVQTPNDTIKAKNVDTKQKGNQGDSSNKESRELSEAEKELNILIYMKKEDVWEYDKLKPMSKYVEVFNYLKTGDMVNLQNWCYSNLQGDSAKKYLNGYWNNEKTSNSIITALQKLSTKPEKADSVKEVLTNAVQENKVDLAKLSTTLNKLIVEVKPQIPIVVKGNNNNVGNTGKVTIGSQSNGNQRNGGQRNGGRPNS